MNVNRIGIASMLIGLAAFWTTFSCAAQSATVPNSVKPVYGSFAGQCLEARYVASVRSVGFSGCDQTKTKQGWYREFTSLKGYRLRNAYWTTWCIENKAGKLYPGNCGALTAAQNFVPGEDLDTGTSGLQTILLFLDGKFGVNREGKVVPFGDVTGDYFNQKWTIQTR